MTRQLWQSTMIAFARSSWIKAIIQGSRSTSNLAKKHVAGETQIDGVARATQLLNENGIRSSLFYMGEYVNRAELIETNVRRKIEIAKALGEVGMDIHVSVDPTQIGHQIDPGLALENAGKIAGVIRKTIRNRSRINCLMFDMEDASLNDPTIATHNALHKADYPVALTLQAYLKRTMDDMKAQVALGTKVRLVKGAFAAGSDIAFTKRRDIKRNSRQLIDLMLSNQAKSTGFYPIIATHDTNLQDYTIERANQNGWQPGEYEFEMLLGVREDVARSLVKRGERVRLYVPFGRDWWPYAARRIGENPANVVLLVRSLIS